LKNRTKVIIAITAVAPFALYLFMAWIGFGLISPLSTDDAFQVEPHAVCQHQGYSVAVTYTPWKPYSWKCANLSLIPIPIAVGSKDLEIEPWYLTQRSGKHAHYKGEGTWLKAFHWECLVERVP